MFSMLTLFVGRGFNDGTGPPDHIVKRSASRNHRINGVLLFDFKVKQHRPVVIARHAHSGQDLRALTYGDAADSVSFGQFHKIGIQQRRGFIVTLVEKFLPLANHPQKTIVNNGNVDFQFLLHDRRKFRHGHLEAAVADDDPDFGLRTRYFGSYGRRQGKAHGSQTTRRDQRTRLLVFVILRFPHLVLADVGYNHGVSVASFAPQIVDDVRRVKMPVVGKFLNVAYGGIALQPVDRIQPLAVIHGLYAGQQRLQYFTQISNQRHVHFYVLVDFGRIDLDVNLLG